MVAVCVGCGGVESITHTDRNVSLQSAGAGEGGWVRVGATEAAVEGHRLFAATLFEDIVAERHCCIAVEDAVLHKEFEGVLVEDFCPEVAVVACAISAAEDVSEICGAVAWNDFVDQTHLLAGSCFEALNK